MKIRLEKGELTHCPEGNLDLINGIAYEKAQIDEYAENIVRYIYRSFVEYRLSHHPLDVIFDPQTPLKITGMAHTFTRPEIAVTTNGETFPSWIVEFVDEASFDLTMMIKPMMYRDSGLKEYWVIDIENKKIYVFDLLKSPLMPKIFAIPQRIPVGIYKDFFLPYSLIFKKQ